MITLPTPSSLAKPAASSTAKPAYLPKKGTKESLEADLKKAQGRAAALSKRFEVRAKRAGAMAHAALITAEIQGAVFGASFLSGFMRAKGRSLKVWKVDLRWVVGGALVLSGVLLENAAAEHLLALGNGVLASVVSELAFDLGQRFGTKAAAPASTPATTPAATDLATHGVPSVRLLDDGSGLRSLGTLGADGRVDPNVGAALDPIERFNNEVAIARDLFARAHKAQAAGNGEGAAGLRGEAQIHVEYARNIHEKYKVGKFPAEWAHVTGGRGRHAQHAQHGRPAGKVQVLQNRAPAAAPARAAGRPAQVLLEEDQWTTWDDPMGQNVQPGNTAASGNQFLDSVLSLPDDEFEAMVSGTEGSELGE